MISGEGGVRMAWRLLAGAGMALAMANALAADPKAAQYYEDAQSRFDKNDVAGAVIQLKNALKTDPGMLAAHVLLGKALMSSGDPIGAEVELDTALRLGVGRAEVIVPLGQALLAQGKYAALLERITVDGLPLSVQVDVLLLRANAEAEGGHANVALKTLDEARSLDSRSVPVRLAQAAVYLRSGDIVRATAATDEALQMAPEDAGAWNTRGSLLHVKGDLKGALAAYAKASSLKPKFVDPRIARAGLLIDMARLDEAHREVTELLAIEPLDPRANYLSAVVAASRGARDSVKPALEKVIQVLDPLNPAVLARNRQWLLLASLAHFELGNSEKALEKLTTYQHRYPGESGPIKLLASLHLDRGDTAAAQALLEPLVRRTPNDPRALSLLAAAYMNDRNYRRASELLDLAVRTSGGAADIRTDFGLSLIGSGRAESGIEQLKQVFDKDPRQPRAGVALTTLYLRKGEPKRALEVIRKVVQADPANLAALNLLGITLVAGGDRVAGRKAYEQVLERDPGYQAAIINLARLDAAEGKLDVARKRLNQLVGVDLRNIDAMMELAALEEKAGNLAEALRWFEKARAEPKGVLRAGLALADLHMRTGNPDLALALAKETVAKNPESLAALGLLARLQIAKNDARSAQQTLKDMTRYANYDPVAQLDIARLQLGAGNESGAAYSLDKALDSRPDFLAAWILYAEVEIHRKAYAKAEQRIKTIGEKFASPAVTARLRGDLALARGQHAAALSAYGEAQKKDAGADLALRIFRAHVAAGDIPRGVAALEKWHREHPGNLVVMRAMADGYLRLSRLGDARSAYEAIVKVRPDDALVYNNLALIANRQGGKDAIALVEKAYGLRPSDPVVIDTYGWLLLQAGQTDRALGLLRDARLRAPGDPEIRYHLAAALSRSGRKAEAKEQLGEALKLGAKFEGIDDARRLMAELGK